MKDEGNNERDLDDYALLLYAAADEIDTRWLYGLVRSIRTIVLLVYERLVFSHKGTMRR